MWVREDLAVGMLRQCGRPPSAAVAGLVSDTRGLRDLLDQPVSNGLIAQPAMRLNPYGAPLTTWTIK
jgi:hypothetical protein